MNQCHFLGNLVRDPELRSTQSGKRVVNLTIAVNRRYKQAGQTVKEAAFLKCEAWDTGADLISKYFKKGDAIIVHCSVRQDEWESEGQKRTALVFRINSFDFPPGGRKPEGDEEADEPPAPPAQPAKTGRGKKAAAVAVEGEAEGDIPF